MKHCKRDIPKSWIASDQPTIYNASGEMIAESAYGNRMLWTGREWEAGAGFYHFRHRAYLPEEGRFMQSDPIGLAGGWNY